MVFSLVSHGFQLVSHDPHLKLAVRIVVCDGIVALQGQGMESNEVLEDSPPTNG